MEVRLKMGRRLDDGQTIGYKVLGMLQQIAPDKEAQDACTLLFHRYNGPCKEQDQAMVAALYDGLAYGNWPWVKVGG
jgi:hypothetical protein